MSSIYISTDSVTFVAALIAAGPVELLHLACITRNISYTTLDHFSHSFLNFPTSCLADFQTVTDTLSWYVQVGSGKTLRSWGLNQHLVCKIGFQETGISMF